MSKILEITKNIALILLLILNKLFYSQYGLSLLHMLYSLLIIILAIITIKDYYNKNTINKNSKYNILMLIIELVMISILLRVLYDTNFAYNITTSNDSSYLEKVEEININYLEQNLYYFIILTIMGLIYRKINMSPQKRKLHFMTSILLITNIATVIPSISCLNGYIYAIWYLIFILTLIVLEVFRLIKDNGKRKDYPIYICFFFNTLAIICVIVNLCVNY